MSAPRPLIGLAAGLVAGLAASAAMAAFQSLAAPLAESGDDSDPSTVKAADAVSTAVRGTPIPKPDKPAAGQAVHYITGALIGGAYGVVAEYWPQARAGFGSGYGLATSLLFDEAGVPATGLSPPPAEVPLATHVYGLVAHLVYGVTLEGARTLLAGSR